MVPSEPSSSFSPTEPGTKPAAPAAYTHTHHPPIHLALARSIPLPHTRTRTHALAHGLCRPVGELRMFLRHVYRPTAPLFHPFFGGSARHLGFTSWEHTPTWRGFSSFYGFYGCAQDYYWHGSKGNLDFHFDKQPKCGGFDFDTVSDLCSSCTGPVWRCSRPAPAPLGGRQPDVVAIIAGGRHPAAVAAVPLAGAGNSAISFSHWKWLCL